MIYKSVGQWRVSHLPNAVHESVSVAADVDTSKLQVDMTVICSGMGFLSDKCMLSNQTGSTAPA